ncbi:MULTISPECIES: CBS domain-containing protein [unclassified Bradyrhizobium]|uniref:CBS domain-containing protein n=1 Tax=unclassified Bradyrhizobium TaxID=2631580 RepID=UPI001FF72F9E|nr:MULTISPECIES: CBS domain-containing protein [unclassified Bradyrhizobium]MCK1715065.1 CBS domain-containing protein [Bradyrhizobium sp. 143]MCK1730081.1 CBS domain-containing protein [Bradyrhizobium sp. 142]
MKISEVMTRDAKIVSPTDTLQQAAKLMKACDCGVLPVGERDRLVGMITDRDIAVRCIAEGKGPDCKVRDAMTQEVRYCFEDEDTSHVCANMSDIQVRRLPVLDRSKRLVGIVSLGDLARRSAGTAKALHGIVRPSQQHNQSVAAA